MVHYSLDQSYNTISWMTKKKSSYYMDGVKLINKTYLKSKFLINLIIHLIQTFILKRDRF